MTRSLFTVALSVALSAGLFTSIPAHANDKDSCEYFAQFIMKIRVLHDAGKTKAETMDFARQKAKQDRLDEATVNLFVGEAIDAYYPKPKYLGTQSEIHEKAYSACINNTLP